MATTTPTPAPEFDHLPAEALIRMRDQMIEGQIQVGLAVVFNRATGEAVEGARIRAALVERIDANLLARGVDVPPPFWLED